MEGVAGRGAPLGWAGSSSGDPGTRVALKGLGNSEEGLGKSTSWKEENRNLRKGDWVILDNEQPVWTRDGDGPRLREVAAEGREVGVVRAGRRASDPDMHPISVT